MSEPVFLRVYDLSDGAVRVWSPVLLGKRIEGIWHTGIALYGMEYFYGGGITMLPPSDVEETYKITPYRVHQLGTTEVTQKEFERYLVSIKQNFTRECYDLIKWNCNNFSDHVSRFLLKRGIPAYIMDLPAEITNTFLGKIVINFIKMFSDAPAVDSEAAEHPKQTLTFPPSFNRSGRRSSCPGSPVRRQRFASADFGSYEMSAGNKCPQEQSAGRKGPSEKPERQGRSTAPLPTPRSVPPTSKDKNSSSSHQTRTSSCNPQSRKPLGEKQAAESSATGSANSIRRSSAPTYDFTSIKSVYDRPAPDNTAKQASSQKEAKNGIPETGGSALTSRPPRPGDNKPVVKTLVK